MHHISEDSERRLQLMVRIGLFGEISDYFSFYFGLVLKWDQLIYRH